MVFERLVGSFPYEVCLPLHPSVVGCECEASRRWAARVRVGIAEMPAEGRGMLRIESSKRA